MDLRGHMRTRVSKRVVARNGSLSAPVPNPDAWLLRDQVGGDLAIVAFIRLAIARIGGGDIDAGAGIEANL